MHTSWTLLHWGFQTIYDFSKSIKTSHQVLSLLQSKPFHVEANIIWIFFLSMIGPQIKNLCHERWATTITVAINWPRGVERAVPGLVNLPRPVGTACFTARQVFWYGMVHSASCIFWPFYPSNGKKLAFVFLTPTPTHTLWYSHILGIWGRFDIFKVFNEFWKTRVLSLEKPQEYNILENVLFITLDNATSKKVAIDLMKTIILLSNLIDGYIFQSRCVCHFLTFIA